MSLAASGYIRRFCERRRKAWPQHESRAYEKSPQAAAAGIFGGSL
jgi:hypothetical protein